MKLLVTGVTGFVGAHLVNALCRDRPEVEIFGLARPGESSARLADRVTVFEADLDEAPSVAAVLDRLHPDWIIHLAAQSSVHYSWSSPEATLRTNVLGLLHVLEAIRERGLSPRILVVGSADEYGDIDAQDLPVREDAPLRPNSPYAVSKVAQGYLAYQYARSWGMGIVRTRTFPHTGPGRGESFAESSFARQIAEIEAGQRPPVIEVGNLDTIRDMTDVRDVVRAYSALLERGSAGEVYNVCSGKGIRIRDLLDALLGVSGVKAEIAVDPIRLRPADVPVLVGDPAKLKAATGWEPRISLEQTLRDLLAHWREAVGAERKTLSRP